MRIVTNVEVDADFHESTKHGDTLFPYASYYSDMKQYLRGEVPWHWHEEFEFSSMILGSAEMNIQNELVTLRTGEAIFINSNILHAVKQGEGEQAVYRAQVFSPLLVSGGYDSIFGQKYITPLSRCKELPYIIFNDQTDPDEKIRALLCNAYNAYDIEAYGFEYEVREAVSEVFHILSVQNQDIIQRSKAAPGVDEGRIKQMLTYIQSHYQEKLELKDIASAAGISERECSRCFTKSLGLTPFQYVMNYRIRRAAELLSETNQPVAEIAYATGFFSNSYFGKTFKSLLGITPNEYRK